MRKLFTLLLVSLSCIINTYAIVPGQVVKGAIQYDTVCVRLNNKPYYTIKTDGKWDIAEGQITFYPVKITDTGSITLKCLDAKAQLVKMLREGDTINNYFLANMKLSFSDFTDEVQKKKAVSNVFTHRIIFYNCVFGPLTADTTEDQYEEDTKQKKKMEFKEKSKVIIERCKFNSTFSLGKSIPPGLFTRYHEASSGKHYITRIYNYTTGYANFLKGKFKKEYYASVDTIQQFNHNTRILYNLTIRTSQILDLDIANTNLENCSLEDVTVNHCIDITSCSFSYDANYTGKQALEDINFPNNNCIIYANYRSFSPDAFKLNNYMAKIQIHPLVHNFYDTTSNFIEDNENYYNLIKDYCGKHFTNQDMVTGIKARYEREKSLWALEYHAAHVKHGTSFGDRVANFFPWIAGNFIEATVSSGYKGEWKFAIWVILIILTFTCFYYFKHKEAVIDYLNSKFNKELDKIENYSTLKIYGKHNVWRDFARCLWFSTMVFVDPRLPISFFNLRSGFFGMVLTEWLFGLTAIAIFLIFLASNYSFIRTLIGI